MLGINKIAFWNFVHAAFLPSMTSPVCPASVQLLCLNAYHESHSLQDPFPGSLFPLYFFAWTIPVAFLEPGIVTFLFIASMSYFLWYNSVSYEP